MPKQELEPLVAFRSLVGREFKLISRKDVTEVFTPRMSEVNTSMYVQRPDLEKGMERAIKRNSHTLLFGESGNGKSWLYKKVLEEMKVPFVVANCANASRMGSLTKEICNTLIEPGTVKKLGFSEEKAAEIGAYFAKGGLKNTNNYEVASDEPCCGQPKPDTLLSTFSNSMGVTSPNVVCSRREL